MGKGHPRVRAPPRAGWGASPAAPPTPSALGGIAQRPRYTRSKIVAIPWPPPMHRLTSPYCDAPPLHLVHQLDGEDGARRADRVAERDGAAVDVRLLRVEAQRRAARRRDRGERLVQLDEVDLVDGQVRLFERLLTAGMGPLP